MVKHKAPSLPPSLPVAAPARVSRPSHEIRIIGGIWKRTRLQVKDLPGLRPTPDRVRETLFNWLGQDLTGWRCIDVFAGTGVLGFEAASRGARQVLLVEQDRALVEQLQATRVRLGADAVQVQRGDGIAALRQLAPASMDLVLIDPPFDSGLFDAAAQAAAGALSSQGYVYLEAPMAWSAGDLERHGWLLHRHLKAGAVHAHLLRKGHASHA